MKEAQRFPADFDGIIAGAPGLDWTGRAAQAARVASVLEKNETARMSPAKAQLLHSAVLEACDAQDGVTDGVVDDPRRCTFDPGALQCKGADEATCLTPAQVNTARMLYAAQVNPATKRKIDGLQRGSELGWTSLGWTESARATGLDQFRFIVFKDPQWTLSRFNFDTDIVRENGNYYRFTKDEQYKAITMETSTNLIGSVLLYVDFTAPVAAIMVAVPTSNTCMMCGALPARNAAMPAFIVSG